MAKYRPLSLVNYSSSSSEEDDISYDAPSSENIKMPKISLPKAADKLGSIARNSNTDYSDDVTKHGGRIRSFGHERGNWATYVHIAVDASIFEELQDSIRLLLGNVVDLTPSTDIHISFTKTVVLQYHLIDSFCKSLQEVLDSFPRFSIKFRQLKVYTNEEKTRTFLACQVDDMCFEKCYVLQKIIDRVMQEYKLATFYKNPSFHASILWCVGDQKDKLGVYLSNLENITESIDEDFSFNVENIYCKIGNKKFIFPLKSA